MTRNYYTTGSYKGDHSTCGSVIYNYDFDGYVSMKDMQLLYSIIKIVVLDNLHNLTEK